MPMINICGTLGPVPAAPHHGFATFDFNQVIHPAFNLVGAGGGGGAPPGCCLALTIEWLHNWRTQRQGYSGWVGVGGGGHAGVLAHTVNVFGGVAGWVGQTNQIMGGLGFGPVVGLQNGPAWGGIVNGLVGLIAAARYTILVVKFAAGGTHAVGLFRTGQGVYFFDCNHGEAFFRDTNDFADWFRAYKSQLGYAGAVAGPQLWNLRYNP